MANLRRQIIVTTEWVGFHSWDDAPDEVSFLRNKHRHKFNCRVALPVSHNDRDKEFFMVKRGLDEFVADFSVFNDSCEGYAEMLLEEFDADWVEVFEDGENGARVDRCLDLGPSN